MLDVAILGAGELGGAVAQALASRDRVRRIVLVDAAAGIAAGKALDIQQSGAVEGFRTQIDGAADLDAVIGAGLCVIADRAGAAGGEWEGEEGLAMLRRLLPYLSGAPILFAGAQQSELMLRAARELGLARERLVGSAAEALGSALRAVIAMEARCSPGEVAVSVLGAPPAGFVVLWSEASIGGSAILGVLDQVQLNRLEARAARLWPPGPLTLGAAAAQAAEAMALAARRSFNVLTVLDGEFGVRGRVGAVPVALGKAGIAHVRVPELSTRERVRLGTSLVG